MQHKYACGNESIYDHSCFPIAFCSTCVFLCIFLPMFLLQGGGELGKYTCLICQKEFSSESGVKYHISKTHSQVGQPRSKPTLHTDIAQQDKLLEKEF